MRPRLLFIVAAAVLVAAAGGYTAWWFAAAAGVRDGVAAWAEARRAEGYTVAYEGVDVGGFPMRLLIDVAAPHVARPTVPTAWSWRADSLRIETRPWSFDRLRITLPRAHDVTYRPDGGAPRTIAATSERGEARLAFVDGRLDSLALAMAGVAATTADGPVAVARLTALARREAAGRTGITVDARGLALAPATAGPLGRDIDRLAVDATVEGTLPDAPAAAALAAWSEAGGVVEIAALTLGWGRLGVEASGTLALDRLLRPQAALTAEITGYAALIDALVEAGTVNEREGAMAKTFLDLMATPGAEGARVLEVPIAAQDGLLYLGPVPLVRLPPVVPR